MPCDENAVLQSIADSLAASVAIEKGIFDRQQQTIQAINNTPVVSGGGYGYFYNLSVSATVAIGAPFPFDTNGAFDPVAFAHTASATPATSAPITVLQAGVYRVLYSVTVAEARQIALYLDGTVVPSTVYGQANGTAVTTAFAIINIAANQVLTLRNNGSAAALTLVTPSGGTGNNVTNSILLQKL